MAPPIVVCNESHRFLVAEQLRESGTPPRRSCSSRSVATLRPPWPSRRSLQLERAKQAGGKRIRSDAAGAARRSRDSRRRRRFRPPSRRAARPLRRASSSPSASCRTGPKPATAISAVPPARARVIRSQQFVEKPDAATAAGLRRLGRVFLEQRHVHVPRATVFLDELRTHAPAMLRACAAGVAAAKRDLDFTRLPTR